MDQLGFNSGNLGILRSIREYSGMTWGSYRNDSGMTQEYLGDSGRVQDMTPSEKNRPRRSSSDATIVSAVDTQFILTTPAVFTNPPS